MRGMSLAMFGAGSKGHDLWSIQLRNSPRPSPRRTLGNSVYDRVRARILGNGSKIV